MHTPLTEMTRTNWTLMTTIDKRELLKQFDDGDITFKEFFEQYELVLGAEVMDRINHSLEAAKRADAQKRKSLWILFAAAISLAFILSPPIYSHLFGYANAEECAIHTNSQIASLACYDLYPSVKDKALAVPAAVAPRRDGFGCTRATKGRGADQRRRQRNPLIVSQPWALVWPWAGPGPWCPEPWCPGLCVAFSQQPTRARAP